MCEQYGNSNKELRSLERNQKETLELKSLIMEMKNSLEGFKGRSEWPKNQRT